MRKLLAALALLAATFAAPLTPTPKVEAYSHCTYVFSGTDNLIGRCHNGATSTQRFYFSAACWTGSGYIRKNSTVARGNGQAIAYCAGGFTSFGLRWHFY